MIGYQRVKMAKKPHKKGKKCLKDWLNKEKEKFKNQENIKWKWKARNIHQKWEVFDQN